jgi:hypothetical protein
VLALVVVTLIGGNAIVAAHAWRFTHFVDSGTRTSNPEAMGFTDRVEVLFTGVVVPRPAVTRRPEDVGLVARSSLDDGVSTWTIPGAPGAGTALLFHGYGGTKSDLLDEAGAFHDAGWTTVLVDFPGSGESSGDVTTLGWQEAGTVASLAGKQAHPLVLYGKSLGSAAILRAVGDLGAPADALVLENPYDRLVTTVGHRFEALGIPPWPAAPLLVFWGGTELGFDGFAMEPVAFATRVATPTLLLQGTDDPRVHLDEITAIGDALAGPHDVVVFPGAGHVGLYAADPRLWRQAVGDFLGRWAPYLHVPPLQ